jgi:hypothetical protein
MRQLHFMMMALALGVAGESFAETGTNLTESTSLSGLIACRNVPQADARLACFDAEVARLDRSLAQKDVVIVSRSDVKEAQKSVFGLTLPKLGLFGGSDPQTLARTSEEEGIGYIEAKLADARQTQDGKWLLVLEDGARWAQTDTANIRSPKPGDVVRIRKAALGSYMANINGRPAIRVRRLS